MNNKEIVEDLRGKHNNRWNKLPQEVLDDVIDFITNLPAQESHYPPKTQSNREYLSSDLNISKLHKNFISIYPKYDKVISYDFFKHYFKQSNIGFGFSRSDICGDYELINGKINSLKGSNEELVLAKKELKLHLNEADIFFYKAQQKVKNVIKTGNKIAAISMGYEKN